MRMFNQVVGMIQQQTAAAAVAQVETNQNFAETRKEAADHCEAVAGREVRPHREPRFFAATWPRPGAKRNDPLERGNRSRLSRREGHGGQTQNCGGESLRGLTPRLPVPRTATGHRKRSSLTDPGAALSNFFSLKQAARSARSCGQTESKKRPELWAPQREAAARRPVRIDETAPHCPPRAAKISYLKID